MLRAIPVVWLTTAMPPRPAVRASLAANRRKTRFIEVRRNRLVTLTNAHRVDHDESLQRALPCDSSSPILLMRNSPRPDSFLPIL
ncbi:hypothetical protein [Reyranella sp.]|uniref:hypothetical protein n=1 Tax=Reyranella sp. TaxID=1929291 RepID=UPI003D11570B